MIDKARGGTDVGVVDDQYGQPTWTVDVALLGRRASRDGAPRRASITPPVPARPPGSAWPGRCSGWRGADRARVRPIGSAALARPAPRPGYSVLGHAAWAGAGLEPIGDWRAALHRAFPVLAAVPAVTPAP